MFLTILAAAAFAVQSASATKGAVHARSPSAFLSEFTARGYQTEPVEMSDGFPIAVVRKDGMATVLAFGGCEGMRNCTYVVLTTSWEGLVRIPDEWLDRLNADFDLIRLRAVDGNLAVQMSLMLGREGVPDSTFDYVLEEWENGNAAAIREAAQAGLLPPDPAPAG